MAEGVPLPGMPLGRRVLEELDEEQARRVAETIGVAEQ